MKRVSVKYTDLFVDKEAMHKILANEKGTMPADLKAIQHVISAKLEDKKFMEGLVNEYVQAGVARIRF